MFRATNYQRTDLPIYKKLAEKSNKKLLILADNIKIAPKDEESKKNFVVPPFFLETKNPPWQISFHSSTPCIYRSHVPHL